MNPFVLLPLSLLCAATMAQTNAIFPPDYATIPEGPFNSPNLPLANGTSRVQCLYTAVDLQIPSGHQITRLGFRQDTTLTTIDPGRSLQLEVRMGYSTFTHSTLTGTFDNNYVAPPATVFGPALFVLPNLRDPATPLVDGKVWINLTTPFTYAPAAGQNLLVEYRVFGTSAGGTAFNYRVDRADYYSPVVNGPAGCAHFGGTSVLTVDPTRPGLYYYGTMTTAPANSFGVLAVSVGAPLTAPYSLGGVFAGIAPTCMGQVSPVGLTTLGTPTSAGGYAQLYFLIPNNYAFSGLTISAQGLFLDFFAPGGLVVSNGAQVLTGTNPRTSILYASGIPTTTTTGSVIANYCPVAFFTHQ